jgi:signal transduction histidine kinase
MEPTLNLLVIDDSEDDREVCRRALKRAFGDHVVLSEEADGSRGFDAIETGKPHCVLLDYSLPGHDGIEVLKRIRTRHPHQPVILLTGQGNEAIAVQAIKEGAQDYITKGGITSETLRRAIRVAIDNSALRKRIDEQHAALELFSRALAHDLMEPVRTVCSFAQMVYDSDLGPDEIKEYLRYIRDAGQRMASLIDTVLSYLQLNVARECTAFRLDDAVASAKTNLSTLFRDRGTIISVTPLPEVVGNCIQIIQVLQNLMANAANHSVKPVRISIDATLEGETVRVFVRDDGPGIAPEHQHRIFEPFVRFNRDNARSGLGLAICQRIVKAHGGEIGCESALGVGSCFFFSLPAAVAENNERTSKELAVDIPGVTGMVIVANALLVDDRDDDVMIARAMLTGRRGMDCNLFVAHSGEEGIAVIRDHARMNDPVDLVLLDINMPGMNGFEMLQAMHGDPGLCRVPVVMCSGSKWEKDRIQAQALGAIGYLVKPALVEDLRQVIAAAANIRIVQGAGGRPVLVRTT